MVHRFILHASPTSKADTGTDHSPLHACCHCAIHKGNAGALSSAAHCVTEAMTARD